MSACAAACAEEIGWWKQLFHYTIRKRRMALRNEIRRPDYIATRARRAELSAVVHEGSGGSSSSSSSRSSSGSSSSSISQRQWRPWCQWLLIEHTDLFATKVVFVVGDATHASVLECHLWHSGSARSLKTLFDQGV